VSLDIERLYALVPSLYRVRDAERGEPLRALLGLFAHELQALEEHLEQLYDDQFIETCAPWAAPYIGDLIGYRPLHGSSPAVSSPRAEVANTIAYRRRKGTALMLEQLATDVTSWHAHAAEFFEQLATTQYMNHLRAHAPASARVRSLATMLAVGASRGAFSTAAHTAEMRRPETGSGRFNIPNVGIFLWRLQPYALTNLPLVPAAPAGPANRRFRLNPTGADLPLFRKPRRENSISELSTALHVPAPISVRGMALAVRAAQAEADPELNRDDDYGPGESLLLERFDAVANAWVGVPTADIVVADLRDVAGGWNHEDDVPAGRIGVDPERGRVLRADDLTVALRASFHHGFARAIGGGEYERSEAPATANVARGGELLQPHLDALVATGGVLVIDDSLTYAQTPTLRLDGVTTAGAPGLDLVVRARNGARPLLAAGGDIVLDIGARGRVVINGLVVSGGALTLAALADTEPRELVLRHCTLVPGRTLNPDGSATQPGAASLIVAHRFAKVRLEHCIVGALRVAAGAEVVLDDCIVDAGAASGVAYEGIAAAPDTTPAGAEITLVECTVIGKLHAELIRMASNSLLVARRVAGDGWRGPVWAERTQEGCVRFCWLSADSVVPRRHRCLPDDSNPRVVPQFSSARYGDPAYLQLRRSTPALIRSGAGPRWRPPGASDDADDSVGDDSFEPGEGEGGEIGVMNALAQPQREINLRVRLDEYLRVGLRAGVFYAT
jgi:hypothetical protein